MGQERIQQAISELMPLLTSYGLRVIGAILILVAGRIASRLVGRAVERALQQSDLDVSLRDFLASLARIGVFAAAVVAALAKFGIQTASFVAVLGAVGFAIGFALQGSLSNFAAGIMVLMFRPIRVGDWVEVKGYAGSVQRIGLFVTELRTGDNQQILIPNNNLTSEVLTNVNGPGTRRIDLVAGIGYADDMRQAKSILEGLAHAHPKVLAEPKTRVAVSELANSSVNLVLRPWVKAEDYWDVRFDLTEQIKEEFDKHGISIPFPQREIHVVQQAGDG